MIKKVVFILMCISGLVYASEQNVEVVYTKPEIQWENVNDKKPVVTVFFPGVTCSQTQAAKYTKQFIASTGEKVACDNGINIAHKIAQVDEAPEIVPYNPQSWHKYNPYYALGYIGSKLLNWKYYINVERKPDKPTIALHGVEVHHLNFGQDKDIDNHRTKYEQAWFNYPNRDIILQGVSRGSATTFNAMTKYKDMYKDVKLVLLESCFDSIENVSWFGHQFFPWITHYKKNGPSPLASVKDFPKDIPVAFITSKGDKVVPAVHTKFLAEKLAQSRDKQDAKVYLIELDNVYHQAYPIADTDDQKKYQSFVHLVYKNLGLPYVEDYIIGTMKLDDYVIGNGNSVEVVLPPKKRNTGLFATLGLAAVAGLYFWQGGSINSWAIKSFEL